MKAIDRSEFVRVWCEVAATREHAGARTVATRLGTSSRYVSIIASELRKKGVRLPKMPTGIWRAVSVDALNAIVDTVSKDGAS